MPIYVESRDLDALGGFVAEVKDIAERGVASLATPFFGGAPGALWPLLEAGLLARRDSHMALRHVWHGWDFRKIL